MTIRDSVSTAAAPAESPGAASLSKEIMEEKREEALTKLRRRRAKEKKKNQGAKSRHIPQDLIENILFRLPGKSLCRFRRVCKSWNSAISNHKFEETESVLSIFDSKKGQFFHCITDQGAQTHKFPVPWENTGCNVIISNSCNGMLLICVGFCFYLLNPSTHYIAKVLTLNYGTKVLLENNMLIGLCYDESISDYKAVVRIHRLTHSPADCRALFVVASLKGKQWNRVNTTFKCMDSIVAGPVVNGRLHWLVNNKIVRFDPISNAFEELDSFQLPPADRNKYTSFDIGVFEGCICVSRIVYEGEPFVFHIEILTMKEYGASESWTPTFVFPIWKSKDLVFKSYNPLLLRAGKILMWVVLEKGYRWKELRLYNVGLKSFDSFRMPNNGRSMCAVSFVHNFNTPKGYYWDDVEHEQFEKPEGF